MDYGPATAGQVGSNQYCYGNEVPSTTAVRRTIQDAQQREVKAIEDLHKSISDLEQRLAPVLDPIGPQEGSNAKQAATSLSVIERIEMHTSAIEYAAVRLCQLTQRIQL